MVKHAENCLRELKDYKGRLRGYVVEPELKAIIDDFIAILAQHITPPPPKAKVVVDLVRVKELAKESDQVRDMLIIRDAAIADIQKPLAEEPIAASATGITQSEGALAHLLTDLDQVSKILYELDKDEKRLIEVLLKNTCKMKDNLITEALPGVLVEQLVDHINSLSLELLGDVLIVSENGTKIVTDDYRDELDHLYTANKDIFTVLVHNDLPEEWTKFRSRLAHYQLSLLKALVEQDDPTREICRIAHENVTMPELLLDSINELALDTVGDIIIETISIPPVIEAEDLEMVRRII
ncbi:MAG: hypothetical protein JETT_1785 [Candidatus Jettenia ecosi]|uniref:TerB-C domain-containing protein n=1 Tax=Candidatus Jettenia ecosi TaxID=2494326 RepID=A0A533QB26_9BACT|nr:MAG: hypothetical protein JETT_1785 [Candidatus Jettenia ecosi]